MDVEVGVRPSRETKGTKEGGGEKGKSRGYGKNIDLYENFKVIIIS